MLDKKGISSLIHASLGDHTSVVKTLLDHGADTNIIANVAALIVDNEENSMSALMIASLKKHLDIVKLLLTHGASVNLLSPEEDCSALQFASIGGSTEVVQKLVEHGALHSSTNGYTALKWASLYGHIEVVEILLNSGVDVQTDLEDDTPLEMACMSCRPQIVKLLLERGADPNTTLDGESTITQLCSEDNDDFITNAPSIAKPIKPESKEEVVKMLIKHGALQSSTDGYRALKWASLCGHIEIVEDLLNSGVDVQTDLEDGDTPLLMACMSCRPQIVKLLLEKGADPNATLDDGHSINSIITQLCKKDNDGLITEAPLFAKPIKPENKDEVVKMLISSGKVNLEDRLDAFMNAHENENNNLVKILLHNDSENLLMAAIEYDRPDDIFALIAHGTKINAKDSFGRTPLSFARELGLQEIVDILLACGAEINQQRDSEERSSLIHAILNGHTDLAIHLIEQGAALDLQDVHGCSALIYAFKTKSFKMVQFLVANGASIHLKDKKGGTTFDVWPEHEVFRHQELLKTFLSMSNDNLDLDKNYPEIIFHKPLFAGKLDSSAITIGSIEDEGFVLQVLADSLTSATNFIICPCFSGPFELPDEYESASPAYLIHYDKMDLRKDVTIRMHHYASLQSEEDCEDMAFLSASSTPEYRGSHPVYTFKKIQGAKGVFRPGDQVGEISLRHFCIVKAGKRKREENEEEAEEEPTEKRSKEIECLYSARLYRNIQHKGDVTAIFCACLFSPLYIKHCDEVIMNEYTGMSNKGEGRSQVFAQILGDEVTLQLIEQPGFTVKFDKNPTEILKSDIHIPETMKIAVSELVDYPPRLLIYVRQHDALKQSSPEVQVNGLDRQCQFILQTFSPIQQNQLESNAVEVVKQSTESSPPSIQVPEPPKTLLIAHSNVCLDDESSYLELDDLGEVLDTVESLSSEWKLLATKLRIKPSSLDIIQQNHPGNVRMCLYDTIEEWLKLNYDHQKHGRPSWRRLVEAVRTLDGGLSQRIAEIYIS